VRPGTSHLNPEGEESDGCRAYQNTRSYRSQATIGSNTTATLGPKRSSVLSISCYSPSTKRTISVANQRCWTSQKRKCRCSTKAAHTINVISLITAIAKTVGLWYLVRDGALTWPAFSRIDLICAGTITGRCGLYRTIRPARHPAHGGDGPKTHEQPSFAASRRCTALASACSSIRVFPPASGSPNAAA